MRACGEAKNITTWHLYANHRRGFRKHVKKHYTFVVAIFCIPSRNNTDIKGRNRHDARDILVYLSFARRKNIVRALACDALHARV